MGLVFAMNQVSLCDFVPRLCLGVVLAVGAAVGLFALAEQSSTTQRTAGAESAEIVKS